MYKSPVPRRSFLPNDRRRGKVERGTEQELFTSCLGICGGDKGEQVFEQYRSHLKILDARRLTCWTFIAEDPPLKYNPHDDLAPVICVLVVYDVPSNAICPSSVPHLHEFIFSSTTPCCSLCLSFFKD